MVETTTVNYGWTKPEVGASIDNWGGYINSDLDGIDTTVKGVSNVANAAYPASNPSGYQTAAQVTASLAPYALTAGVPVASSTTPAMDGTAAVGTGTTWARADHAHPSDTSRLAISGGTMTGAIVLAADPVAAMQPATRQYVDAGRLGDNRIINGNFAVNQRAYVSGAALAAAAYGHDRWKAGASGCTYTFTAAVPDTTVTITAGSLTQIIEAGMIEGGVYTLSWTGTAQARVYQGAPTGAYAASPITTASLTAGTNTIVEFNAGTVTRVKFEAGAVATPFNRQSLAKSLADCQRYYQTSQGGFYGYGAATIAFGGYVFLNTAMRAIPTVGGLALVGTDNNVTPGSVAYDFASPNSFRMWCTASVSGGVNFSRTIFANAEL
jgi:hypothetical protein